MYNQLRSWQTEYRQEFDKRMAVREDVEVSELGYRLTDSFYAKQYRIALRNSGIIDPLKIEDYIALDGYKALADLLENQIPQADVVAEISESLLRGRGGAGFPTGRKWAEALKHDAEHKFIICNADEGSQPIWIATFSKRILTVF